MYSSELLDHFQNPRNAGELEAPDATARLENPACGDILELSLKLEPKEPTSNPASKSVSIPASTLEESRIAEIRFRAKGCVASMGCGSAITGLVKGKTIAEARRVSREDLLRAVGGLPQASAHAGHLAIDTLAALLGTLT